MESAYKYEVYSKATQPRSGVVAPGSVGQPLRFSAPPEFGGKPGVWTPEHLFVSALASCYVSTFSGIAALSKFNFSCLEVEAEGTLQTEAGGWKFTEIRLKPVLKIVHEEDRERGARLLDKAERSCLIARSITATVELEPEIRVVPEPALVEQMQ